MPEQQTSGGNTPLQASDERQHIEDSLTVYRAIGGKLIQTSWNELPQEVRERLDSTFTCELI
jgi:chaperonin cofactor prefoldin